MVRKRTLLHMDPKTGTMENNSSAGGIELCATQRETDVLTPELGTFENPVEVPSEDRASPDAADPEAPAPRRTTRFRLG